MSALPGKLTLEEDSQDCERERVSRFWEQTFSDIHAQQVVVHPNSWLSNDIIGDATCRRNTGGPKHWQAWLLEDYFKEIPSLGNALSICCGEGVHELELLRSDKIEFVRAFDVSDGAVRLARERFEQAGIPSTRYELDVRDANALDIEGHFGLIMSVGALHHVSNLEDLLSKLSRMLNPDGYFVLVEYVGPNRFQWTATQVMIANRVLAALDPYYLRDGAPGACQACPVAEMIQADPSEAVRSSEIPGLLKSYFKVEYQRHFNGTILHPLYPFLNSALANRNNKDFDSLIRLLLTMENLLVEQEVIPSDHTFFICRRRDCS